MSFLDHLQNIVDHRQANLDNIAASSITINPWDGHWAFKAIIEGPEFWQVQDWLDAQEGIGLYQLSSGHSWPKGPLSRYGKIREERTAVYFDDERLGILLKLTWTV